jgi:phenylacetate-coenzyme A ligase PaaK-like adenylate-forming protein
MLFELIEEIRNGKHRSEVSGTFETLKDSVTESKLSGFQDYLLQGTIKYAYENCDYYREAMDSCGIKPNDILTTQDLQRFPLLTRNDLENHTVDIMSKVANPDYIGATRGTVYEPLFVYVSRDELEANRAIQLIKSALGGKEKLKIGIAASEQLVGHSVIPRIYVNLIFLLTPLDFFMINMPSHPLFEKLFNQLMDAFHRKFYVSKNRKISPTILSGPALFIRLLTDEMVRRGISPKQTSIESIYTAGSYLPNLWKTSISKQWGANVFNTYSLSEHCASAATCSGDRGHHFSISSIPEVVDRETGRPVEFGEEGILVLTSLYPFRQCTPLIRYWTGDVVTLSKEKCPHCGYEGVSIKNFLGREPRCLYLGDLSQGNSKFLSSTKVLDILLQFKKLYSPQMPIPRFSFEKRQEGREVHITVNVEASYISNQRTQKELKTTLEEQIMEAHSWNESFPALPLDVNFLPPSQLPLPRNIAKLGC